MIAIDEIYSGETSFTLDTLEVFVSIDDGDDVTLLRRLCCFVLAIRLLSEILHAKRFDTGTETFAIVSKFVIALSSTKTQSLAESYFWRGGHTSCGVFAVVSLHCLRTDRRGDPAFVAPLCRALRL